MLLLGLAIACYVVAVICGGLGYSGRSSSNLPRLVFGVFLALTFIMIIVVGLVSPAHH